MVRIRLFFTLVVFIAFSAILPARENTIRNVIEGPVEAELVSVIDGDTLLVTARPWPQHAISVLVRIRGIDAPEMKSKCETMRRAARRAKLALTHLATRRIRLTNISGDKYFGRIVADVAADGDTDIGSAMLGNGLARRYDGKRKAREQC